MYIIVKCHQKDKLQLPEAHGKCSVFYEIHIQVWRDTTVHKSNTTYTHVEVDFPEWLFRLIFGGQYLHGHCFLRVLNLLLSQQIMSLKVNLYRDQLYFDTSAHKLYVMTTVWFQHSYSTPHRVSTPTCETQLYKHFKCYKHVWKNMNIDLIFTISKPHQHFFWHTHTLVLHK